MRMRACAAVPGMTLQVPPIRQPHGSPTDARLNQVGIRLARTLSPEPMAGRYVAAAHAELQGHTSVMLCGIQQRATKAQASLHITELAVHGQGNRVKGLCGEEAFEEVVVPSCGFSFEAQ